MNDRRPYITILALAVLLIDVLLVVYSHQVYKGSHELWGNPVATYISVVLLLVLLVISSLYRLKGHWYQKVVLTVALVMTVNTPLILSSSQPQFTYEEGFQGIYSNYPEYESYEVVLLEEPQKTVPVLDEDKSKTYDRVYYYVLGKASEEVYFMVNPYSGQVTQVNHNYW